VGRSVLVDRAVMTRAALSGVGEAGRAAASAPGRDTHLRLGQARITAQLQLGAFAAALEELPRRDRLARVVARGWLAAARSYLWFDSPEFEDAERMAYGFMSGLANGSCPRNGAWRIRRAHAAAEARWHAENGPQISRGVVEARRAARRQGWLPLAPRARLPRLRS